MVNLFILLNHSINDIQKKDARNMGVKNFIVLPPDLQKIWQNISPAETKLASFLTPIKQWLSERAVPGDFVLIQGDFGACWLMVNFSFQNKLIPLYSTTERKVVEIENKDGSIQTIRQFKHVFNKV